MAKSQTDGEVIQITVIDTDPGKQDEILSMMTERSRFMARQPGFLSIRLHRSLDGKRIVNYMRWHNRALLHAAHHSPEFRKEWHRFEGETAEIDPHLYEVANSIEMTTA